MQGVHGVDDDISDIRSINRVCHKGMNNYNALDLNTTECPADR